MVRESRIDLDQRTNRNHACLPKAHGAWGYVLKASVARDLTIALRAVMDGEKFVSEELDGRRE
jgi:DNA-binding NarL/FixJ family response regulator